VCAAWAVLLVARVGLQPAAIPLALWGWLMIALLWIDFDYQLLPDALTFPGALLGLVAAALVPGGPRNALWGVLMGAGLLWVTREGYFRVRKREGLGYGDVKLAAMFGVVLGWQLTLLTLFVSAALGALWGGSLILLKRGDRFTMLPFGTLLAPAALVVFLWGDGWVNAYLRLFHR
jgi:leader peptidase (prepilin peptidase)/N-methyltransferase